MWSRGPDSHRVLESLRLLDFRCFEQLSVEVPKDGLLLVGGNAQGKTSILEAVCLLVRLHSPRSRRMAPMVRHDTAGFGVAGKAWGNERQVRYAGRSSRLSVEGEVRKGPGDYLSDGGLVVWMGNEDIELVRGSGGARRTYLDFLGSQLLPDYRTSLSRYRRVVKARNLLLRDRQATGAEIDAYDELLIAHGLVLQSGRAEMIYCHHRKTPGFAGETLEV
jgi:DNA replication and repair protein RecF